MLVLQRRRKASFSKSDCESTRGKKELVAGQCELKKTRFDPIFSINHTFAMLRANVTLNSKNIEPHQEGVVFNLPFEHLCVDA